MLPVYLPLGSFHEDLTRPREACLAFIRQSLDRLEGQALHIAKHLEEYLNKGRLVLLLDAMDEMPHKEIQRRFEALRALQSYHGNKIIFACRRLNFLEPSASTASSETLLYQRATIKPFDESQVRQFLARTLKDQAKPAANEVLSPNNLLRDMASNPFFLKLFAIFYREHHRLPTSRADLLREYEARILERAATRHGGALLTDEQWSKSFRTILARLAYLITERGQGVFIPLSMFRAMFLPLEPHERARLAPFLEYIQSVLSTSIGENLLVLERHRGGTAS